MQERRANYRKPLNLSVPGVYFYTLGISLLCWIAGYFLSVGYPVYGEVTATPLWNAVCRIIPGKAIAYGIGLILMIGSALLIQRANYVLVLIREKTFLPFVLYILLISTNADFFPLKSTSVGVFCLILSLYLLFKSYHDPNSQQNMYYISLMVGIGSLVWIHILWFLPLIWYGMYKFKILYIKTFFASLLGVLTVYWFLFGWCVWNHDFSLITGSFGTLWKVRLLMITEGEVTEWFSILLVAVFTGIAAVSILTRKHEESLRTRQYLDFLIIYAIFSFLLFFLYEQSSEEYLAIACFPSSILLAHFFAVNHGRWVFWGYHLFVITLGVFILIRLWSFWSITVI